MANLILIYQLVLIVSLVACVLKFKKLTKPLMLVFLFVVFGCLTQITIKILREFGMGNSLPVGNIYFPVSFLILGTFYFVLLRAYLNKKLIIGIILIFEILCILNLIFVQNLLEFPNIIAAIGAIIIIIFAVFQFSKVMTETKIEKLLAEPLIWINTAFLIYYSGNFFFYTLFNLNVEFNPDFAKLIHKFYVGLNILLYALITIGFLKVKNRIKI